MVFGKRRRFSLIADRRPSKGSEMSKGKGVALGVGALVLVFVLVAAGWQAANVFSDRSQSEAVPLRVPADPKWENGVFSDVAGCLVLSPEELGPFSGGQYIDIVRPVEPERLERDWVRSAECVSASMNVSDLLVSALPESTRPPGDFVRSWKVASDDYCYEGDNPQGCTSRMPVWVSAKNWWCTEPVLDPLVRRCEVFPARQIVVPEGVS
uniref:hypothetical protein n=2 Tax=Rhodococcus erythropolis TaxID=1833 RepID=UPI00186842B7|nr:hypothetical protein [Rhodococcus erythropolis]